MLWTLLCLLTQLQIASLHTSERLLYRIQPCVIRSDSLQQASFIGGSFLSLTDETVRFSASDAVNECTRTPGPVERDNLRESRRRDVLISICHTSRTDIAIYEYEIVNETSSACTPLF